MTVIDESIGEIHITGEEEVLTDSAPQALS